MSQLSTVKTRHAAGVEEDGSGRASGARPQLLSQLPGSVFTSPGFLAGLVVVELLYGLVLLAAMSGSKKEPAESQDLRPTAQVLETPKALALAPTPAPAEPPPNTPPTPAAPEPKAPTPTPAPAVAAAPPPASPAPVEAPKASAPVATVTPAPAPPTPPAEAIAKSGVPEPGASAPASTTMGPLGPLIDPLNDCRIEKDGDGVTIHLPASLHAFIPDQRVVDSPRALATVVGDFVAQVRVPGSIRPGTKSIPGLPFTFQGAGLLLWQDPDNYVRFERAAGYSLDRGGVHQVMVETCKEGRPGKAVSIPVREGPITLRLERRGSDLQCTYSSDGKTWLRVKQWSAPLPAKLEVGISASNASPRPFAASFENFQLKTQGKGG